MLQSSTRFPFPGQSGFSFGELLGRLVPFFVTLRGVKKGPYDERVWRGIGEALERASRDSASGVAVRLLFLRLPLPLKITMKFITSPLSWMEIRLDAMKLCCDKIHELLGTCSCCFYVYSTKLRGRGVDY